MLDDDDFDYSSSLSKKVDPAAQAKQEREDKISDELGNLMLRGCAMLAQHCDVCGTVMLRDRQKNVFCVACTQFPEEPEAPPAPEPEPEPAKAAPAPAAVTVMDVPSADRMAMYASFGATADAPPEAAGASAPDDDGLGSLASRVLDSLRLGGSPVETEDTPAPVGVPSSLSFGSGLFGEPAPAPTTVASATPAAAVCPPAPPGACDLCMRDGVRACAPFVCAGQRGAGVLPLGRAAQPCRRHQLLCFFGCRLAKGPDSWLILGALHWLRPFADGPLPFPCRAGRVGAGSGGCHAGRDPGGRQQSRAPTHAQPGPADGAARADAKPRGCHTHSRRHESDWRRAADF